LLLSVGLVYCCGYDGGCLYDFDYNGVYNWSCVWGCASSTYSWI
jgi:hypothetical protein